MSTSISNINLITLLESLKPITLESFNKIKPSSSILIKDTTLEYLVDLKIIICLECKIYINPILKSILKHLRVSF
jgi:hypothetical protein